VQIVSIAALRGLFAAWRQAHYNKTGHWIWYGEIELLIHQIADIIQRPDPGEKVYSSASVPLSGAEHSIEVALHAAQCAAVVAVADKEQRRPERDEADGNGGGIA